MKNRKGEVVKFIMDCEFEMGVKLKMFQYEKIELDKDGKFVRMREMIRFTSPEGKADWLKGLEHEDDIIN